MKRLRILGLVFLVVILINLGIVNAARCDNRDIIFRLNKTTNSHVEVWDGTSGNYGIPICFSDYFSGEYTGASPHDSVAGGTNKVIRVSRNTNAHAENPAGVTPGYFPIYYGDLTCVLRSGSCSASEGCAIASLSRDANAHVGLNNSYPLKLCCKSISMTCGGGGGGGGEVCGDGVVEGDEECESSGGSLIFSDYGNGVDKCGAFNPIYLSDGDLNCYPSGHVNECTINSTGCVESDELSTCETYDPIMYLNPSNNNWTNADYCADISISREIGGVNIDGVEVPHASPSQKEEICDICSLNYLAQRNNQLVSPGNRFPHCSWSGNLATGTCIFNSTNPDTGESCIFSLVSDRECSGDETEKEVIRQSQCGSNFVNETIIIPCPKPVQFPFFTAWNFLASVIGIVLVYFVYLNYRKEDSEENEKGE